MISQALSLPSLRVGYVRLHGKGTTVKDHGNGDGGTDGTGKSDIEASEPPADAVDIEAILRAQEVLAGNELVIEDVKRMRAAAGRG